jgi:hypothetical protein
MIWLRTSFAPYCERNNVHLLREDLQFIEEQLKKIPSDRHRRIMKSYFDEWCLGIGECENASQVMNEGRRRANLYLLEVCG